MECTPFNITVVLVAPGGVKSNIAQNQRDRVGLPPDSLYGDYVDAILAKLNMSQSSNAMLTAVFVEQVTNAVLRPHPPRYLTLANMSATFSFLQWLPRGWVLRMLWKRMGEALKKPSRK